MIRRRTVLDLFGLWVIVGRVAAPIVRLRGNTTYYNPQPKEIQLYKYLAFVGML